MINIAPYRYLGNMENVHLRYPTDDTPGPEPQPQVRLRVQKKRRVLNLFSKASRLRVK